MVGQNEMIQAKQFSLSNMWSILIADFGINPNHVLRYAGLPDDLFSRENASISAMEYFNLWNGLEQASQDKHLALKIGQYISIEMFDPAIFACLCSPNLNIALQRLSHFKPLMAPVHFQVDVQPSQTIITINCTHDELKLPPTFATTELVFITELVRIGTREKITPQAIFSANLPDNLPAYSDFFGLNFTKDTKTQIVFSAVDANKPFLTENNLMWDMFEPDLKLRLKNLSDKATMNKRVKGALLEMLPSGQTSIDEVAKRLAFSKRSLQRHLGQEGHNFQRTLNNTRLSLAEHYLSKTPISTNEIAFLLGFQDGHSFTRAFKNWTGQTPLQFRD